MCEVVDEKLTYNPIDFDLQVDMFVNIDSSGESVFNAIVSLDKDSPDTLVGSYTGSISDVKNKLDSDIDSFRGVEGKRLLFIRSINSEGISEDQLNIEVDNCNDLYPYLQELAPKSECFFLVLINKAFRPLMKDGMFYTLIKVAGDGKPNEFSRQVMGRLSQIIRRQNLTGLQPPRPGGGYRARQVDIEEGGELPVYLDEEIAYRVVRKGVKFEFFSSLKSTSNKLIVFGQSAVNQDLVSLPAFRRWSWTRSMSYSAIVLNDPTLYLDKKLGGGWFLGEKGHYYTETIVGIIKEIASQANIDSKDIVFLGASAGGFTSITMAAHLEGASCVVDVAQTNLISYMHQGAIEPLIKAGFGVDDYKKNLVESEKWKLVASDVIRKTGYLPNLYFLQNTEDWTAGHVQTQFAEFMMDIAKLMCDNPEMRKSKVISHMYNRFHLLKGGHFPLPQKQTLDFLDEAINLFCDN